MFIVVTSRIQAVSFVLLRFSLAAAQASIRLSDLPAFSLQPTRTTSLGNPLFGGGVAAVSELFFELSFASGWYRATPAKT